MVQYIRKNLRRTNKIQLRSEKTFTSGSCGWYNKLIDSFAHSPLRERPDGTAPPPFRIVEGIEGAM